MLVVNIDCETALIIILKHLRMTIEFFIILAELDEFLNEINSKHLENLPGIVCICGTRVESYSSNFPNSSERKYLYFEEDYIKAILFHNKWLFSNSHFCQVKKLHTQPHW